MNNNVSLMRSNERILFQFAGVICSEDEGRYEVYTQDQAKGRREPVCERTASIHKAWVSFIGKVDVEMRKRIEAKFGPFGPLNPWVDPDGPSQYIVDLQSPTIRPEYEKRQVELNGRINTPLNEVERLRFDLDMVEKYRVFYPLPETLEWKLKTIQMQYRNALRERDEKRLPQQA